jgi:hypothetical protein
MFEVLIRIVDPFAQVSVGCVGLVLTFGQARIFISLYYRTDFRSARRAANSGADRAQHPANWRAYASTPKFTDHDRRCIIPKLRRAKMAKLTSHV